MINETVLKSIESLRFGEPRMFRSLAILPVFAGNVSEFAYISMTKALQSKAITIKEVSDSGSVPDLIVINTGDMPVLILDGEEMIGAKQNRVANSTILIKEKSETDIPVSCTEAGRWSYKSSEFADSDVVMAREVRSRKLESVSASLEEGAGHRSDQSQVWDDISCFEGRHFTQSSTSAMRDVFEARHNEMDEFLKQCPLEENQIGLIAYNKGKVSGMDVVSRADVYRDLHDKLLKSYAIDALLDTSKDEIVQENIDPVEFIVQLKDLKESSFASVGYGTDYRYKNGSICGSALVHDDTCIHMAFFAMEDEPAQSDDRGIASFRQRRRNMSGIDLSDAPDTPDDSNVSYL